MIDNCTWPTHLPIELYLEIQTWLCSHDYYQLMNVCQKDFKDIRFHTIHLLLPPEDSKRYLDSIDNFSHKLLSKIKNAQKQLTLHCDNIVHFTASSLKLQKFSLKCSNTHEIALFPEWQEYLSNRDSLHLDNNRGIADFTGLNNIRKLTLYNFKELSTFSLFESLEQVELAYCYNIFDLNCFKNVKRITITGCPEVQSLQGLELVPFIQIFDCVSLTDISSINIRNKSVAIMDCPEVRSIKPLFQASYLSTDLLSRFRKEWSNEIHYNIKRCFLVELMDCNLRNFPNLQELYLMNCHLIKSISHDLSHIPVVTIDSCFELSDISGLGGTNHKHRSILILYCQKIQNFKPLENVPHVQIVNCANFKDFDDVKNVKHLEIFYCSGLTSFTLPGDTMTHLEFRASNSTTIDSYERLREVPYLQLYTKNLSLAGLGSVNQRQIKMDFPTFQNCWQELIHNPSIFPLSEYEIICYKPDGDHVFLRKIFIE